MLYASTINYFVSSKSKNHLITACILPLISPSVRINKIVYMS